MGRVLLLSSGVQWNDTLPTVGLSAMLHVSYVYYSSFPQMQLIFVWLFVLTTGQLTYILADGDVAVDVAVLSGREASTVIKQLDGVFVNTGNSPPAMNPTLGARIWLLQVYHLIWEGGSCTGPTAVDK